MLDLVDVLVCLLCCCTAVACLLYCCCTAAVVLLSQGWKLDAAEFPAIVAYLEKIKGMPTWQRTLPVDGDAAIIAGWERHMSH